MHEDLMRLLFAKPTYGPPSDPSFDKSHRAAIMFAANKGVTWVGDASPDRMGWAAARNAVVEQAVGLGEDADGVFWVDDDLKIPIDTIARLVAHNLDFVSALYFQRGSPYWPVFGILNANKSFEFPKVYQENVVAPCDGVGFGCVYTSTRLLTAVSELPECQTGGPFGGDFGQKTYGEDFTFCLRAMKVGFRPHVDTGVQCEHHIGPEFANAALFKHFRDANGGLHAETR
jgi:hypothetical protein